MEGAPPTSTRDLVNCPGVKLILKGLVRGLLLSKNKEKEKIFIKINRNPRSNPNPYCWRRHTNASDTTRLLNKVHNHPPRMVWKFSHKSGYCAGYCSYFHTICSFCSLVWCTAFWGASIGVHARHCVSAHANSIPSKPDARKTHIHFV